MYKNLIELQRRKRIEQLQEELRLPLSPYVRHQKEYELRVLRRS